MKPTRFIDLHCDTLTDNGNMSQGSSDTLNDPDRAIAFSKVPKGAQWAQFFAIFVPDTLRGKPAADYFDLHCKNFHRQLEKFSDMACACKSFDDVKNAFEKGKFAAILTVEGGAALAGELSRVKTLADAGVKALTLVWNGENELGSGHKTENGLTEFGRQAVEELEKHNILIDVSHLNDPGFEDLLKVATKPFIASHSNARAVAGHKRNLTDAQIKEIVKRGGLIGLNFYVVFLRDDKTVESLEDLYQHAQHMIELGAGDCIALGSDFDGSLVPDCLRTVENVPDIYDYFVKQGMSPQQADKIMFTNAYRFFERNF